MNALFGITAYAAALISANLLVARWGVWVVPLNAFFLIGLDLALRDVLQGQIRPRGMLLLLGGTGVLTYLLNPAAGHIAAASAVAFSAAAFTDWAVFVRTGGGWLRRSNLSNTAGAAVDSVVFQALAFGGLDPAVLAWMFLCKVAGGATWAWLLSRRLEMK